MLARLKLLWTQQACQHVKQMFAECSQLWQNSLHNSSADQKASHVLSFLFLYNIYCRTSICSMLRDACTDNVGDGGTPTCNGAPGSEPALLVLVL